MLYDAPSAFILYKAILFSIHNSRIACFLWYFALKLRNACHYKLAYTETLKIKIISLSDLQNENARRFFLRYQSTRSLANQNTCFKSCFYVKAASLSYDDISKILINTLGVVYTVLSCTPYSKSLVRQRHALYGRGIFFVILQVYIYIADIVCLPFSCTHSCISYVYHNII